MSDPKPLKDPRRCGPVARAVVDLLHNYGITGARYFKRKHFSVEFECFEGGETIKHPFACTPRDSQRTAKQVTRKLEDKIVAAIGRAP